MTDQEKRREALAYWLLMNAWLHMVQQCDVEAMKVLDEAKKSIDYDAFEEIAIVQMIHIYRINGEIRP